jgi:hypothetical protein
MTIEEEREFLAQWNAQAIQGGVLTVPPIHAALVEKLGRDIPMVVDGASSYRGKELVIPENVALIRLPPYSPESVTTGKAGCLKDCEPLKAVYSTDSLTTIRWSTI